MKPEVLIKAGAILLPKAKLPKDILSDDVVARQWNHPVIKDDLSDLDRLLAYWDSTIKRRAESDSLWSELYEARLELAD